VLVCVCGGGGGVYVCRGRDGSCGEGKGLCVCRERLMFASREPLEESKEKRKSLLRAQHRSTSLGSIQHSEARESKYLYQVN